MRYISRINRDNRYKKMIKYYNNFESKIEKNYFKIHKNCKEYE